MYSWRFIHGGGYILRKPPEFPRLRCYIFQGTKPCIFSVIKVTNLQGICQGMLHFATSSHHRHTYKLAMYYAFSE